MIMLIKIPLVVLQTSIITDKIVPDCSVFLQSYRNCNSSLLLTHEYESGLRQKSVLSVIWVEGAGLLKNVHVLSREKSGSMELIALQYPKQRLRGVEC